MDPSPFYDDLADHFDLIFVDWEISMERQGSAIAETIQAYGDFPRGKPLRVLDVAAGIGT